MAAKSNLPEGYDLSYDEYHGWELFGPGGFYIKIGGANMGKREALAKAKEALKRIGIIPNPNSTETDWIPVHAIRKLPDGSIQLLTEKGTLSNPSKRKSFMGKVRRLFSKNPSARYTGREVRKYIVRGTDEDRYFMTMAKARSFLKRYAKLHGYRSIPESPYWIEKSETRDTF